MLSRSNLLLWISINNSRRCIKFPVPLPLFVIREMLEPIMDIVAVVGFFNDKLFHIEIKSHHKVYTFSYKQVTDLFDYIMMLLTHLSSQGAYDLVNVRTPDVEVIIRLW